MRIIESQVKFLKQGEGIQGLYEHIENCGRTCYKSENNIKEGSAEKFVNAMINSNHGAMLEHGTVYLMEKSWIGSCLKKYEDNKFSKYKEVYLESEEVEEGYVEHRKGYFVTTNLRVLVENGWLDDLKYMCEPSEYHEKRYTLRFVCDRGVTHELVRHRKFSFAQESSRYCNYGSDKKFGKELTFISPSWCDCEEIKNMADVIQNSQKEVQNAVYDLTMADVYDNDLPQAFTVEQDDNSLKLSREESIEIANQKRCELMIVYDMIRSEKIYMYLIEHGYKPQQARQVLPTMIKSEICMTGFASDWRFFFDLRLYGKTGVPHPDMLRVAKIAQKQFIVNDAWSDIIGCESKFD